MVGKVYIVQPEVARPQGGVNVAFSFAELLAKNGQPASVHFQTDSFVYPFVDSAPDTTFSPFSEPGPDNLRAWMKHLRRTAKTPKPKRVPRSNRAQMPDPGDFVILPEYSYHLQADRFGDVPHGVLVQDVYGGLRGTFRPLAQGLKRSPALRGFITTSQASSELVSSLSDLPHAKVPLFVDSKAFSYVEPKKRQIAVMPRKRRADVETMVDLIRAEPRLAGFETCLIEGVPYERVLEILGESLIFLSFSWQEGFGLPPAEAMARGCIVIGYPGIGGREYFDPAYSYPVPDDDFAGFFGRICEVCAAYDAGPAEFDAMRRRASEAILGRYTREKTQASLMRAVADLAPHLPQRP
ncbi:MAG: glycosyltransferase [Pseudomonadota bacterium]